MATATADAFQSFPLPISHLSLPVVLKCGQSFRWSKVEHLSSSASEPEWRLTLQDRVVCLRQTPTTLLYRAIYPSSEFETEGESRLSTLHWLKDYFQLEVNLIKLFSEVKDPVFQNAVKKFEGGIRILRQDPWENLLSFICSQNNHISRITGMVQNLCTHFSDSLLVDTPPDSLPIPYYPFPSPQLLSDPSVDASLRGLGFGYRAKYIQKTAAMLCEEHDNPQEWLLSLRDVPTAQAREELLRLPGVGPKVADCILLMSLDKHEVVPIDTHMLQIAIKHYNFRVPGYSGKGGGVPPMTPKLHIEVSAKLQKIWGPYAGWAQGVLFTSDLKAFSNPSTSSEEKSLPSVVVDGGSPDPRITQDSLAVDQGISNWPKRKERQPKRKADDANASTATSITTQSTATTMLSTRRTSKRQRSGSIPKADKRSVHKIAAGSVEDEDTTSTYASSEVSFSVTTTAVSTPSEVDPGSILFSEASTLVERIKLRSRRSSSRASLPS